MAVENVPWLVDERRMEWAGNVLRVTRRGENDGEGVAEAVK